MQTKRHRVLLVLGAIATLLLITNSASAQEDETPKKHLRSPAVASGVVGGESHDSYVIRADQGRIMTVQISWLSENDNRAEFTVSESPNFFTAEQVGFGKEDDDGKRWIGKVPKTQDYFIYVVAHPTARYTLNVTVK